MTNIRVRELRMVRAGDLTPSPYNWRRHPDAQRAALEAVLEEIGYVDALKAREVGSDGAKDRGPYLELIDGHLRAGLDPDQEVPVLILDLDDDEAQKAIATFDPVGAMAESDDAVRRQLLASIIGQNEEFERYLESCRREVTATVPSASAAGEPELRDIYLVTIEVATGLYEEFRQMLQPWRERDGVTVNVSSPD